MGQRGELGDGEIDSCVFSMMKLWLENIFVNTRTTGQTELLLMSPC